MEALPDILPRFAPVRAAARRERGIDRVRRAIDATWVVLLMGYLLRTAFDAPLLFLVSDIDRVNRAMLTVVLFIEVVVLITVIGAALYDRQRSFWRELLLAAAAFLHCVFVVAMSGRSPWLLQLYAMTVLCGAARWLLARQRFWW